MSRQKTKIREWLERHGENGDATEYESESLARSPSERVRGKLARVTRYRLAPLVELPPFNVVPDTGAMTSMSVEHGVFAAFGCAEATDMWWGTVGSDGVTLRRRLGLEGGSRTHWWRTEEEARTACEERLRDLGYRVARAKDGAK